MPYTVEKLPDEPILVVNSSRGEDPYGEMAEAIDGINQTLDEQPEPIYLILDMRTMTLSLDEIMEAAMLSARGRNAMLHHRNIRESIFILTDPLVRMAVRGLDSATFGQLKARTFETLDQAVAYCRRAARQTEL